MQNFAAPDPHWVSVSLRSEVARLAVGQKRCLSTQMAALLAPVVARSQVEQASGVSSGRVSGVMRARTVSGGAPGFSTVKRRYERASAGTSILRSAAGVALVKVRLAVPTCTLKVAGGPDGSSAFTVNIARARLGAGNVTVTTCSLAGSWARAGCTMRTAALNAAPRKNCPERGCLV